MNKKAIFVAVGALVVLIGGVALAAMTWPEKAFYTYSRTFHGHEVFIFDRSLRLPEGWALYKRERESIRLIVVSNSFQGAHFGIVTVVRADRIDLLAGDCNVEDPPFRLVQVNGVCLAVKTIENERVDGVVDVIVVPVAWGLKFVTTGLSMPSLDKFLKEIAVMAKAE